MSQVHDQEGASSGPEATSAEAAPSTPAGVRALEGLVARGAPTPDAVVSVLDAYRGDREAMFAYLHQTFGNGFVQQVIAASDKLRLSVRRRELVSGDPSDPSRGFFVASQQEQGARWRTGDGRFTGSAGKEGLDTRYQLDDDDAIHARVGKDRTGTIGWERDGKTEAELYGAARGGGQWEAGVRRPWELDGGTLTTGVRHQVTPAGARDEAVAGYRTHDGSTTAEASAGIAGGEPVGRLAGSHVLDGGRTVGGSLTRDPHATTIAGSYRDPATTVEGTLTRPDEGRTTGSLSARHQLDPRTSLSGSYARTSELDAVELGAAHQVTPELGVTGGLRHEQPLAGRSQTTLSLGERYRSGELMHGLDLTAGTGHRDYVTTSGSIDGRLGPELYAGAFGSYTVEEGKHGQASLGGSLTFTPTEKTALTLAGVVDQDGVLETRLQLDLFKQKIDSLDALSKHKKDALVSLFVSYSSQMGPRRLDDRFGGPQLDAGHGQVMGGIRIKF